MTETAAESVLKRKAEAGRGHGAGAPPTPAGAFGLAFAKAAEDLFGLPVEVAAATELRASLAELPERLPDRALLCVLEGPQDGLGLAALSPEVLATLIEMQTTGRLGAAEVSPRRPTRTDAAMVQRFLDRVVEELEKILAADPALTWAGGFRYGSFLDDPRPLGLLFEDAGYRLLALRLGFGAGGARQGSLIYAVPAEGRGPGPLPPPGGTTEPALAEGGGSGDWGGRMERAVLEAEVRIEAVLDRLNLPLAEVAGLRPGALLPLGAGALSRLRVEGLGRRLLATGRLGQCQGHLAVRLDPAAARGAGCACDGGGAGTGTGTGTGTGAGNAAGFAPAPAPASVPPAAPPSRAAGRTARPGEEGAGPRPGPAEDGAGRPEGTGPAGGPGGPGGDGAPGFDFTGGGGMITID